MNAKQRAQAAYEKLLAKVQAAMTTDAKVWGFRNDAPEYGISDGLTYTIADERPDFVKKDDDNWNKL